MFIQLDYCKSYFFFMKKKFKKVCVYLEIIQLYRYYKVLICDNNQRY